MRNLTVVTLTLITFLVASCSKDDSSTSPTASGGSMTASIDGSSWSSSMITQATVQGGVLAVAGQDGSVRQIQLRVINFAGQGTYAIGSGNMHLATVVTGTTANEMFTANMIAGSGSIVITESTASRVKGTFTFTARNTAGGTKSVTNGNFDVPISQ